MGNQKGSDGFVDDGREKNSDGNDISPEQRSLTLVRWRDEHREVVKGIPEPRTYLAAQREAGYWAAGKLVDPVAKHEGHSV